MDPATFTIVTLALSFTVSEIRPLIAWNFSLKIAAKPLQMKTWQLTGTRKRTVRSPTPLRLTVQLQYITGIQ